MKNFRRVKLGILVLLTAGSAALCLYWGVQAYTAEKNAAAETERMLAAAEAEKEEKTAQEILAPVQTAQETLYAVPEGCCGILEIPALDLVLPILDEYTEADLKLSPCRYAGSPEDGSLVVVGHNYAAHFGRLKELREGDEAVFTCPDGTAHTYRLSYTEYLEDTDVEEMLTGGWDMTLFTCSYSETSLYTLRFAEEDGGI